MNVQAVCEFVKDIGMQHKKIDVWVGLFVLLGLAGLVVLALRVGGGNYFSNASTYAVTANFQNVGGLKSGSPIKLSGVVIGRVGDINLVSVDGEYKAQVTLLVNQDIKVPADSSVAINTSGLLGAQFVSVTQGFEVDKPVVAGGSLDNTQSAMVLEDLITQFGMSKAEAAAESAEDSDKK